MDADIQQLMKQQILVINNLQKKINNADDWNQMENLNCAITCLLNLSIVQEQEKFELRSSSAVKEEI